MAQPADGETLASVLLSFRAENARSFRDSVELSLLPTAMGEKDHIRQVRWREGGTPIGVLPVAAVFGANASGKSNLLRIMHDMRSFVLASFRFGDPTGGVSRYPFRLDETSRERPTRLEVDLIVKGVRHEYGFTFDDERVLSEWAYRYPKGRAALLFERELDEFAFGSTDRSRSKAVLDLLRPNALYLSTAASANHPALLPLFEWFSRNLLLAEVSTRSHRQIYTARLLEDPLRRDKVMSLLRAADLGIVGATTQEADAETRQRLMRILRAAFDNPEEVDLDEEIELRSLVALTHRGATGEIDLHPNDESLGTLTWFGLVGPVVDVLERGAVLLADELDASLHPTLVNELVRIFQSPKTNPNRAQLIFNTHDLSLLGDASGDRLLGRDQIWFSEKNNDGATRLYSLTDLGPRKREAIARRYLEGRYGGIPILSQSEFDSAAHLITSSAN